MDHPVVEVRSLRKRYGRGQPLAVDGVSFRIERGQAFGLLGPNGAGKTTVVKMITGLVWPDDGAVEVLGSAPGDPKTRAQLGFAPEEPDFPKFLRAPEVLDYFGQLLGLGAADRKRRVAETLAWCGLSGEGRQVRQFSKGMKQRLGLGQALLGRPRLVIFDEPTADLDPLGRRDVRELILRLKADGVAVLLNSHLLSEVERVCDTVAIMDHGHVLTEGPMATVVPEGRSLEQVFMEQVDRADRSSGPQRFPAFLEHPQP